MHRIKQRHSPLQLGLAAISLLVFARFGLIDLQEWRQRRRERLEGIKPDWQVIK